MKVISELSFMSIKTGVLTLFGVKVIGVVMGGSVKNLK